MRAGRQSSPVSERVAPDGVTNHAGSDDVCPAMPQRTGAEDLRRSHVWRSNAWANHGNKNPSHPWQFRKGEFARQIEAFIEPEPSPAIEREAERYKDGFDELEAAYR